MSQQINPGDSNKITRDYFDSLLIEFRHIDSIIPDTGISLFGKKFDTPVTTAALSHLERCHPEGLTEMARGAKAANAVAFVGMGDEDELDRITATGAKSIKIIKQYADNDVIFKKIKHAEKCGCLAVGMDFDHAFTRMGKHDEIHGLKMAGKSLDELKSFVAATTLPFVIKGVLSTQDALKCIEAGVQGIVVSHHAGIMSYAVPPLMILPEIVEAVGKKMKIFVDCGIESGMDAFKALALGADAVSVGRPLMEPLKEKGAEGVKDAILKYTAELAGVMAFTCSHTVTNIDPKILRSKISI